MATRRELPDWPYGAQFVVRAQNSAEALKAPHQSWTNRSAALEGRRPQMLRVHCRRKVQIGAAPEQTSLR